MAHFVSASCQGVKCSICLSPATHKVGEEIMHDEPCMKCGTTFKTKEFKDFADNGCANLYHFERVGASGQRHNLTAYVCCFHFRLLLGAATECPLSDAQKAAIVYQHSYVSDDIGLENCRPIQCVKCHSDLYADGNNINNTVTFVLCKTCGTTSIIKITETE